MSDAHLVADASLVLAIVLREPLGSFDADRVLGAAISSVNVAEVLTRLISSGLDEDDADESLAQLNLSVFPFDGESARLAARLWPLTRRAGLSLGDRACIALGLSMNLPVVTADRAWAKLDFGRIAVIR